MNKKYELTDVKINYFSKPLYRIRALRDFSDVKKGDIGGYIEKEENLSHEGNCWVYEHARVLGYVTIRGNSKLRGISEIIGET